MTDESKKEHAPDPHKGHAGGADATDTEERQAARGGWDNPPEAAEGAGAAEADPLEALRAENAELKDQVLRIAAEMENLRRRTARDVKDARAYSVTAFARDMLAVSDNLKRAIDAVPAEAREKGEAGLAALIEGVDLTEREMHAALERHGVKKLEPAGQRFDPNFHQAMFEVPNTEVPNNTVIEVVQSGYVIGDRVLRPAMVGVAKGGPKQAPAADPAAAEPGPPDHQATRDA